MGESVSTKADNLDGETGLLKSMDLLLEGPIVMPQSRVLLVLSFILWKFGFGLYEKKRPQSISARVLTCFCSDSVDRTILFPVIGVLFLLNCRRKSRRDYLIFVEINGLFF